MMAVLPILTSTAGQAGVVLESGHGTAELEIDVTTNEQTRLAFSDCVPALIHPLDVTVFVPCPFAVELKLPDCPRLLRKTIGFLSGHRVQVTAPVHPASAVLRHGASLIPARWSQTSVPTSDTTIYAESY